MTDFVLHETSPGAGRAIDVREVDGVTVGRVLRGEIAGCEKRGTFRFEPGAGTATSLGIRSATGAVDGRPAPAAAADPGPALFGLLVLLPFLHRIYTEETELIEALLE